MAQSEKIFRDILCEGRALPAETTDPAGARTIDELRKQVSKLKWELEAEKQKIRQLHRDHEIELKRMREEHARKLETSVESANILKNQEKLAEIKRVEERLLRQNDHELKTLEREKNEEIRRVQRRMEHDRDDSLRVAIEVERKRIYSEFQEVFQEDELAARDAKLKNEVFMLGEQNERLEDQVRNLTKENRSQIELLRRMKHEHEAEIGSLMKKHQSEASRDMAQLRLAERMIMERDQDLHTVEYRADMVLLEKEAIAEELAHVKSVQNVSITSQLDTTGGTLRTPPRSQPGGPGGLLQKRVEELDALVRKLEEERSELKQENASLRKKRTHDSDGEGKSSKQMEEKLKKVRKRNADLVALAKQLDDKYKSLRIENEQLQKQTVTPADAEQQLRKTLSRHHAKDIMEYTKQIHAKDREIDGLKKRVAKFEAGGRSHETSHETSPELEKKMRAMAMEKLRMERVITRLYAKLPDAPEDVEGVSHSELERTRQLAEDNQVLRRQLEELRSSQREEVDQPRSGEMKVEGVSIQKQGKQVASSSEAVEALRKENESLVGENDSLKTQVKQLTQFESEAVSLKASLESTLRDLEEVQSSSQHRVRQLTQQLETAKVAIQEMEGAQDHCSELEREVAEVRGALNSKDTEICQLELECRNVTTSLEKREQDLQTTKRQVLHLESIVSEKERQCRELQVAVEELQSKSVPRPRVTEVGLQTDEPLEFHRAEVLSVRHHRPVSGGRRFRGERVKSPVHRLRMASPRTSLSGGDLDLSLDNEIRAAGYEIDDSFDSSEGVGFSETTLDDPCHDSTHSLESFKSDMLGKEEERARKEEERARKEEERARKEDERVGREEDRLGEGEERVGKEEERAGKEEERVGKDSEIKVVENSMGEPQHAVVEEPDATSKVHEYVEMGRQSPLEVQALSEHVAEQPVKEEGWISGTKPPVLNLEELGEEEEEEEDSSDCEITSTTSSESDLPGLRKRSSSFENSADLLDAAQDGECFFDENVTPKVSIFIARFTYKPAEMSPNPNYDQELFVSAGDYLYVYGDIDEDGFYHGQLPSGQVGLIPSNFIERVMDESEVSMQPPRKGHRRLSNLQDIEEEDEEVSSGDTILPPQNLELERQFVEGTDYSVVIQWEPPRPLPAETSGYNVYVNGEFKASVHGADEKKVILSGIPRHQLVKISVRTVTEEGESPDPLKLVVLNPHYPEPPTNIEISQTENLRAILVQWTPAPQLSVEGGTAITGYAVYLNNQKCVQLAANETPTESVCAQLLHGDLKHLKFVQQQEVALTVRALAGGYESVNSCSVVISKEMLTLVLEGGKGGSMFPEEGESESSHISISSGEDDRELYSPARRSLEGPGHVIAEHETQQENHVSQDTDHVTQNEDHVTQNEDHVTQNEDHLTKNEDHVTQNEDHVTQDADHVGQTDSHVTQDADHVGQTEIHVTQHDGHATKDDHVVNGADFLEMIADESDGESRTACPPRYYRALFNYNPFYQSPNNETADEELFFWEGDIILAKSEMDEDGFFEGDICGQVGFVPGNMVEEITSPEELAQLPELLAAQAERRKEQTLPTMNGGQTPTPPPGQLIVRLMRALGDYDPSKDSPNSTADEELSFKEGDILTVYGKCGKDGYREAEFGGKRGYVPCNFLEEVQPDQLQEKGGGGQEGEQEGVGTDEESTRQSEHITDKAVDSTTRVESPNRTASPKRNILSRGKGLSSKGLGKRKQ